MIYLKLFANSYVRMEGMKFEQPPRASQPNEVEEEINKPTAEVIALSDWREAPLQACKMLAERAPGLIESEASLEKVQKLQELLAELASEMQDSECSVMDRRLAYYQAEEVARVLAETESLLEEQQILQRQERTQFLDEPPAGYGAPVHVVPRAEWQDLSPANDNRPANGRLPAALRRRVS